MIDKFGVGLIAVACGAWVLPVAAQTDAPIMPDAPDVIVTAKAAGHDPAPIAQARERLSRTPGAVAVVAAEAFEDRLSTGLADVLRDVPGVLASKRFGEESRLSIRGSGIGQGFHQRGVLLAENGVSFADADGFSDFQKVDVTSARLVEVYKGGNALRFGGAQLGGAVNLVTTNGRTAPAPVLVRAEGGSFATARGQVALSAVSGDVDAYGAVTGYRTHGYRVNSGGEQVRGTVNLGVQLGADAELRLIATGAVIEQGAPGTLTLAQLRADPRQASAASRAGHWARDQHVGRISVQSRVPLAAGLMFEGGVYTSATRLNHPISIVIEQDIHTHGGFGRLDLTGQIAGLRADVFAGISYRSGALAQRTYANVAGEKGAQTGNARQMAQGLDLFAEGRLFVTPQLALVAGASWGHAGRQYVNHMLDRGDRARAHWLAPRAGILWETGGTQVYGNVTRSVEPPTFGALVQSGYSGFSFVPVDVQRAWTAEVGTRGRRGALSWDIAAYRADLSGEILNFTVSPEIPAASFNAGHTRHQGVEAGMDWHVVNGAAGLLRLRQSWSWSDFRFRNDPVYGDARLPVVPVHQLRTALRYGHNSGIWVEPMLDWRPVGGWVDYRNSLRAPGYALVHLSAGVELTHGVTLFADARNLTHATHVSDVTAVVDARGGDVASFYPGEGRSLFIGGRMRF